MLAGNASGGSVNNFLENCSAHNSSVVEDSAEMYCLRDDDSFKHLDAGDFSGAGTAVNNYESFGVHNITETRNEATGVDFEEASQPWNEHTFESDSLGFSPLADEEVMPKGGDCFNTTFCNSTHSVPIQSGGAESKAGKETSTRRNLKSCANAASEKVLLNLSSLQFARRKRSSLRKQARCTEWGGLRFVPSLSDQNTSIDTSPEKPRRSRKSRVADKGKQGKNRNHKSIKLIHKQCTPTGPISLKIRIGKETICPVKCDAIQGNKEDSQAGKDLSHGELPGILRFQPGGSGVNAEISGTNGKNFNDLRESLTAGEVDGGVVTIETTELDLGTSPDSEVINQTPDAQSSEKDPETLCHSLSSYDMHLGSRNVSLTLPCKSTGKEKGDIEHYQTCEGYVNCEVPCLKNLTAVQEFPEVAQKDIVGDMSYYSDASTSTAENESLNRSSMKGPFDDSMDGNDAAGNDAAERAISRATTKAESQLEANLSPRALKQESLESNLYNAVPPCSDGKKLSKCYRISKQRKSDGSGTPNSSIKKDKTSKSSSKEKSSGKSKRKDKKDVDQIHKKMENESEPGIYAMSDVKEPEEAGTEKKCVTIDTIQKVIESSEVMRELPSPSAWASCDECEKWRRIPIVLADRINETKCRWVCKDNMDKDFADCSIPQEKSNAEINAELEISDASGEEGACDFPLDPRKSSQKQLTVTQQPFTLIKSNAFLHRRRKNQPIDEIMVCHCKPSSDGRPGCGDGCLNRVLNIECIQGTCPCFDSCSNQKFQKRKYAKLKSLRCGKKGFGLQVLHDVSEGEFLIEYVGEVLDMHAYEARQKEYALLGHRHFYFMTLNGSEVIDACAKGNLGRFINHSCEPNCRTEKWHVNGEVCIGIFALRDIKKGEEVTFDYNYVRVFGAAAKKCVCGSSQCRGYIGGDPLNAEDIVQGDSDDDYPEPVMIREQSNTTKNPGKVTSRTKYSSALAIKPIKGVAEVDDQMVGVESFSQQLKVSPEKHATDISHRVIINIEGSSAATLSSEITKESRDSSRYSDGQQTVQLAETSSPSDDIRSDSISAAPKECSVVEKNVREDGKVPLKLDTSTKIPKKPSSVKKSKPKTDAMDVNRAPETVNKVRIPPFSNKRLLEAISSGRFEAVQEKLNQLLDHDGGISKRKDASRGYLKLLLLTATSDGSDHNGAIQSNRDLSMILDGLLKTRSKTVLVDIINKNGLQMLHNMLKRYRKEFSKIPILRKLLKVLEYLATREIITSEHINWGPRPGVASLKVSMLKLTEHADKQVHQIARNFRDRWIPRCFRKRDDSRDFHINSSHDRKSASYSSWNDSAGVPSETIECAAKPVAINDSKFPIGSSVSRGTRKRKSRWDQPGNEISGMGTEIRQVDGVQMDEDVPPGFPSPMKRPLLPHDVYSTNTDNKKERFGPSKHPHGVSICHPLQRFNSRLSVSYGVPLPIVQQFGVRQCETSENWIVAPGMPFQPFPPLPSYPRLEQKHPEGLAVQKAEQDTHSWAPHDLSQNLPTTSGSTVGMALDAPNQLNFQRVRSPENLSRKYFRQQKWNNSVIADHQTPMKNAWGPNGHDPRNQMCQGNIGSDPINYNGSYRSENVSSSVQSGATYHQHANQLNQF